MSSQPNKFLFAAVSGAHL